MKPILIVTATQQSETNRLLIKKSIENLPAEQYKLEIISNNKTGLPRIYNQFLDEKYLESHDILLFVHDDVFLYDPQKLQEQLYSAIEQFDIIGIAGASKIKIEHPALWHTMADKKCGSGVVWHSNDSGEQIPAVFGTTPKRCIIMDGLFLAINVKKILEKNWRFNENYNFHHYDIASCLDAHFKGLNLGTWPIKLFHKSKGLLSFEDEKWNEGNNKFLEEYKRINTILEI